jgi:hypothetical protein
MTDDLIYKPGLGGYKVYLCERLIGFVRERPRDWYATNMEGVHVAIGYAQRDHAARKLFKETR